MSAGCTRNNSDSGIVILLVILILTVLLISGLGDLLAYKVLVPVLGTQTPTAEPISTMEGAVRSTITTPELSLYIVQTGAYAKQENAQIAADELSARGGAGYILYDGVYRVFACCYATAGNAQSVVQNLQYEYNATVYNLTSGSVSLCITAPQSRIDCISNALLYYRDMLPELVMQSIELDKGEIGCTAMRANAAIRVDEISKIIAELESVANYTGQSYAVQGLIQLFSNAKKILLIISLENSVDPLPFCSEIRYNLIELAKGYCNYTATLMQNGGK